MHKINHQIGFRYKNLVIFFFFFVILETVFDLAYSKFCFMLSQIQFFGKGVLYGVPRVSLGIHSGFAYMV